LPSWENVQESVAKENRSDQVLSHVDYLEQAKWPINIRSKMAARSKTWA